MQIGALTLPEAPTLGQAVSVLADTETVIPEGVAWDLGGEPTVTGRILITLVWSGVDWVGTYSPSFAAAPEPPDETAPTAGTLGMVMGATTAVGTVTGAADETALDAAPYSFRADAGTWSAWQAGATYEWTGLTAETEYDFQHRVRDAAGNVAEGVAVTDTTDAAPADSTPPTAGTLAGSSITSSGFTLTVTGAADETALHGSPYRFSTDDGDTYSAWQSSASYAATGLDSETEYTCKHQTRDAAGNVATGTSIQVETNAAGPFDPLTDITWQAAYEAAEITGVADGGAVATWDDSSGNGLTLSAIGDSPTYDAASATLNGQPTVVLAAAGMETAAFTALPQPGSLVFVGRMSAINTTVWVLAADGNRREIYRHSSSNLFRANGGTDLIQTAPSPGSTPAIVIATFDGASSTIRVNGSATQNTGNAGTASMGRLRVGANSTGVSSMVGEVAFVGVKAAALTAQEISDLESWAATKYGVTIS